MNATRFKALALAYAAKHTASPEAAMACLVDVGILNSDGTLASAYAGDPETGEDGIGHDRRLPETTALLRLADALCEAACEICNQMEEAEPFPSALGRPVPAGRSPVWAYERLSAALNAYHEARHRLDGTIPPLPGPDARLPRHGTIEDEVSALRKALDGVIGLLDAGSGKAHLDAWLPGARSLLQPLSAPAAATATQTIPTEMTVPELQAEIASLQALLHFKILGDPRDCASTASAPPLSHLILHAGGNPPV